MTTIYRVLRATWNAIILFLCDCPARPYIHLVDSRKILSFSRYTCFSSYWFTCIASRRKKNFQAIQDSLWFIKNSIILSRLCKLFCGSYESTCRTRKAPDVWERGALESSPQNTSNCLGALTRGLASYLVNFFFFFFFIHSITTIIASSLKQSARFYIYAWRKYFSILSWDNYPEMIMWLRIEYFIRVKW